jgi:hypothetical protein
MSSYGHAFDMDGKGMRDPTVSRLFDHVLAFLGKHGM